MRWDEGRRSENVEDRRGARRGPVIAGAGGGIGLLVVVLIMTFLGGDPRQLLQQVEQQNPGVSEEAPNPAQEQLVDFVSLVLGDTEDVWDEQFRRAGREYVRPKLVLFNGSIDSACGFASAAVGPFYCPADQKVYIDLKFYDDLRTRFKAPGDFAQAYVIAHEIGHHVQNLLGISDRVHEQKARLDEREYNQLSVRLELQADFLAGVWAHHAQKARHILEAGDIAEGLRAASAIGDDSIQKEQQGYVVPDSFTHGTSEQRRTWFLRGLETGDMAQGDTFGAAEL
jgi:predicted metalloprotease